MEQNVLEKLPLVEVDMHCHSYYSDGSENPLGLCDKAEERSVKVLAVTDHDISSHLKQVLDNTRNTGAVIIPGIEISAYDYSLGKKVHILGYFIDPNNTEIDDFCSDVREQRYNASQEAVDILIRKGYEITWGMVKKYANKLGHVYKRHIIEALMHSGYGKLGFAELYKKIFSCENGSRKERGIAYIPITYVDVFQAIEVILNASGLPVIAHPGLYNNYDIIPELKDSGLSGIEVFHPLHTYRDMQKGMYYCGEYRLFPTGGSDYHGSFDLKPNYIGSFGVEIESFNDFMNILYYDQVYV